MEKILCFGDSNTWGYDPQTGSRYDEDKIWPGLLEQEGKEVINAGVCGRTTDSLDELIEADRTIIMLGTNDLMTPSTPLPLIIRQMRSLLIHASAPLLLVPSAIHYGMVRGWSFPVDIDDLSHSLGSAYVSLADELGIPYLCLGDHIPMGEDGIHFTLYGHQLVYQYVSAFLKEDKDG